jgi:hypothetical protein
MTSSRSEDRIPPESTIYVMVAAGTRNSATSKLYAATRRKRGALTRGTRGTVRDCCVVQQRLEYDTRATSYDDEVAPVG